MQSGVLHHRSTRTLMGGPFGIKWPFLILARAYWSNSATLAGTQSPHPVRLLTLDEAAILIECAEWLTNQIEQSVSLLHWIRHSEVGSVAAKPPAKNSFQRANYWVHRVGHLQVSHTS